MVTLNGQINSKGDNLTIFNWINWVPYFIFNRSTVESLAHEAAGYMTRFLWHVCPRKRRRRLMRSNIAEGKGPSWSAAVFSTSTLPQAPAQEAEGSWWARLTADGDEGVWGPRTPMRRPRLLLVDRDGSNLSVTAPHPLHPCSGCVLMESNGRRPGR